MEDLHSELQKLAPVIRVEVSNVFFLEQPVEFYNLILEKISSSENHIYLSTLYIGTDSQSKNIVSSSRYESN